MADFVTESSLVHEGLDLTEWENVGGGFGVLGTEAPPGYAKTMAKYSQFKAEKKIISIYLLFFVL